MHCELIATEEHDGFTIRFYACEEDLDPRGEFMNEDGSDDEDTIAKIVNGTCAWFCAKVTASKGGVELGTDYLGGCCYNSPQEFWATDDGYKPDMIATAIAEARKAIEAINS